VFCSAVPVAHVSLRSLIKNYQTIAAKVQPATVAAVVKANAYGLGAAVAPTLAEVGCSLFFVAWPGEGQAVRAALQVAGYGDAEVAVFNGFSSETAPSYRFFRLTPVLNTDAQYRFYQQTHGLLPPMVQVETGMHRSGFCDAPVSFPFPVRAVFSHLACADTPHHPLNQQQAERLRCWKICNPTVPISLGASWASLTLPPFFHGDFVRVGAALYDAIPHVALKPVLHLHAPLLETRRVDRGGGVGYASAYVALRETTLATLGLGYADGYPRSLGGKGRVMVGGVSCPVVGRVSMDMLTVDVSAVPDVVLKQAKVATVYGDQYTVNDAASDAGTIGYEMLTRLGGRLAWTYTQ
jgi:alanine racemase